MRIMGLVANTHDAGLALLTDGVPGRYSCARDSTSSTSRERHCIFLGSGASVASKYRVWSACRTRHRPGPGRSPETCTSCSGGSALCAGSRAPAVVRPSTSRTPAGSDADFIAASVHVSRS